MTLGLKFSLLREGVVLVLKRTLEVVGYLEQLNIFLVNNHSFTYAGTILSLHLQGEWLDRFILEKLVHLVIEEVYEFGQIQDSSLTIGGVQNV